LEAPSYGIIEIAGPERFSLSALLEQYLKAKKDPRTVLSDANARYYGYELTDNMLVPHKNARLGSITFKKWFDNQNK